MKVHVKQPMGIGGHDYAAGIHEIPDVHASHWFFLAMQNNGGLVVLDAPKKVKAHASVEVKSEPVAEEPSAKAELVDSGVDSAPEEKPSKGSKKKKRG